jgi:hypothetical protein
MKEKREKRENRRTSDELVPFWLERGTVHHREHREHRELFFLSPFSFLLSPDMS